MKAQDRCSHDGPALPRLTPGPPPPPALPPLRPFVFPQVADDLKVPSPSTPVTHSANASSSPIKAQISDGALQQQKPPQLPMSFQPSLVPTGRLVRAPAKDAHAHARARTHVE